VVHGLLLRLRQHQDRRPGNATPSGPGAYTDGHGHRDQRMVEIASRLLLIKQKVSFGRGRALPTGRVCRLFPFPPTCRRRPGRC